MLDTWIKQRLVGLLSTVHIIFSLDLLQIPVQVTDFVLEIPSVLFQVL